jgi:transcriptional regulator of acetoin/glycerol metabolism
VYATIKGRSLLLTITTADGHVVRTCGDPSALKEADKLNFGPGALWAEEAASAPTPSARPWPRAEPTQVFGPEHYCESHHRWSCSAAPFFDPLGNIVGCFDISGPSERGPCPGPESGPGRRAQSWNSAFSSSIAPSWSIGSCALVTAAFNSVLTGMLSIDAQGYVADANLAAETLLGVAGSRLKGHPAEQFFDYDTFLARHKDGPPTTMPIELPDQAPAHGSGPRPCIP